MLDKSKIIEQVKKLLEVNQSNGATDAEATRSGLAAGDNFRISDELESENDA